MSAKMRRRRARARRKGREIRRREDGLFFAHGTIPSSARAAAECGCCGGRAFARDLTAADREAMKDFDDLHAGCAVAW